MHVDTGGSSSNSATSQTRVERPVGTDIRTVRFAVAFVSELCMRGGVRVLGATCVLGAAHIPGATRLSPGKGCQMAGIVSLLCTAHEPRLI